MYIIDKHKDYYDHLSYIYGVDKKVVYDRRGSNVLTDESLYNLVKGRACLMHSHRYILLEVGSTQYLIKPVDINVHLDNCNCTVFDSFDLELVCTYKNNVNYYGEAISIRWAKVNHKWGSFNETVVNIQGNYEQDIIEVGKELRSDFPFRPYVYNNPILKGTSITSLITNEEIWKELQTYISSLQNDKDYGTIMTDVEKAEVHGFDKRTSFRNIK